MTDPTAHRIRTVDGDLIGTTAFFRNRAFLRQLGEEIASLAIEGRPVDIFVHACSIGAEAYSIAIHLQLAHPEVAFRITCSDLSPGFVGFAKNGVYPAKVIDRLEPAERAFFDPAPNGAVSVGSSTRALVTFDPPGSFVDYEPGRTFDVVTLCNALVYVPAAAQAAAIERIARYNSSLLALTGGHHDTVAEDLARNGYEPVMASFEAIHAGWTDRQRPQGWRPNQPLPPNIHADPYLGPIDDSPGWRYRHGALFRKQAIAAAA